MASLIVIKSADESRTNDNTLSNDTELLFPIGASESWVAYFTLYFSGVNAGSAKISVTVPSGATGQFQDTQWNYVTNNFAASETISFSGGAAIVYVAVSVVNSTNAGNVQLQWAQNAVNATPSVLHQFSSLVAIQQ